MMHIQKFVDRVRGFEARGSKDFIMSVAEAKDLHADITRLLINIQTLQEKVDTKVQVKDEVVTLEVSGGSFK